MKKNKSLNSDNIGLCILAHNRLKHFKKTLAAVLKFKHKEDKIYIFFDNYSENKNRKKYLQCIKVEKFLNIIKSSKIIVSQTSSNIGPRKNWYRAYSSMFKIYKKVIVLEDDIVIKKHFFPFMRYYLNKFEKYPKIMSITGYASPVNLPNKYQYDCFLSNRSMSWSKASWKRAWNNFRNIKLDHKKILKSNKNKKLLCSAGKDLLRTIHLDYLGMVNSFQVWWIWNILKRGGYCVNPTKNLINNIGFDGSGFHMFRKENFIFNKNLNNKNKRMQIPIFNKQINNSFQKNFNIKYTSYLFFRYFNLKIIKTLLKIKYSLLG